MEMNDNERSLLVENEKLREILASADLHYAILCDHNESPEDKCPLCSARWEFPQQVGDLFDSLLGLQ